LLSIKKAMRLHGFFFCVNNAVLWHKKGDAIASPLGMLLIKATV